MSDIFTVGATTPIYINASSTQPKLVASIGGTLYYKTASTVSTVSSDGTIATGASATFTAPEWVISNTACKLSVSDTVTGSIGSAEITDASVTSADIAQSTIVDADVAAAAALSYSKFATMATGSVLAGNAGVPTATALSGDATVGATGVVTVASASGAFAATGATTTTGGIASTSPAGYANVQITGATNGTDTAFVSGTLFVTSIFIPANKTLTGIGYLLGSVGGTDKIVVQLNSASGTLLANSTLTAGGTTAGTAANTQKIAFTSTYAAKGPATYYIGVSGDTGTAKLRTVPTFLGEHLFANSLTQTVSVPATIVPPTGFTLGTAPYAFVY